jgi:hypothetical protein
MVLDLLVLFISIATWIAVLWLAIAPDFTAWPNFGIIALHALPPLAIWLTWMAIRRRIRRRKSEDAQAREQHAQAERDAAREAARQRHEDAMRQRRFGCDCRFVTFAGIALASELPLLNVAAENIEVQSHPLDEARASAASAILEQLAPAIWDAIENLFRACAAASAFPIFIQPPADTSGEETLAVVRNACNGIAEKLGLHNDARPSSPQILFMPSSDSAANSAITLFDSTPDLPGAVVLAFDSPLARIASSNPENDTDRARQKRERQAGKPSEGVVALLLTNPDLESMLKAIDGIDNDTGDHDSMTPYWRKSMEVEGHLALLSSASREQRGELAQLPVLGRIRRAVFRDASAQSAGVLETTRIMQESLEQAQINAGIIDLPFSQDEPVATMAAAGAANRSSSSSSSSSSPPTRCHWLVHNAGGVDYAGKRLAALGAAMYYFNIDLNPVDIDMSTNIVTRAGDLGRATGISQLALGIAHAADTRCPALCAEFSDHGGFAVSFITPAGTPEIRSINANKKT